MIDPSDQILIKQLIRDEGERLKAYKDSLGIWTIGVGHNFQADNVIDASEALQIKNGISETQVIEYLTEDLAEVFADLDRKQSWWRQLDDPRQRVLANMCFNMGVNSLSKFVNTLMMIKTNHFNDAADAMLKSLWAKQVGDRAVRLSDTMRTGIDDVS